MTTTARLMMVLLVAAASAGGAASPPTPPAVVALARAGQDAPLSELAAGLAVEAGHWLVNRDDVVVRMVNDPGSYSKGSFAEVNDRLSIDLIVWVEVHGTTAEPVVSYMLETSSGEARAAKVPPQILAEFRELRVELHAARHGAQRMAPAGRPNRRPQRHRPRAAGVCGAVIARDRPVVRAVATRATSSPSAWAAGF
jgi:hypothetical protein